LTRSGRFLPIPRQASLLLTVLLERAGEVVTREEIQRFLWPDGEHLGHEHAINRTVNNLRMVLRDNARKTRYIGTVPKRGYYFIAEVSDKASIATSQEEVETSSSPDATPLEMPPVLNPGLEDGGPMGSSGQIATDSEAESEAWISLPPKSPLEISFEGRTPPLQAKNLWSSFRFTALILSGFLILAGGATYLLRHQRHAPAVRLASLGVTPFETQDAESERLGESFRSDLMEALSQLPSVQLRASHSLDTVKHDDAGFREVSRLLNLDLLLIGKFRLQDKICQLDFELVRGPDAVHVASFQYTGTREELATIRDKVQRDIFRHLTAPDKSVQAVRGSTENAKAYAAYLSAHELAYQRTGATLAKSIKAYQAAIREDPSFARAYAGMGTAYLANYVFSSSQADFDASRAAASKALELDPDLAEAHGLLGIVAYRTHLNSSQGEVELRKAIALEPHQASYHAWLSQLLVFQGRFDEALREIDRAHADDPLWPQIFNIEVSIAGAGRDYERAIRAANRFIEMSPDSIFIHDELAWSYFGEKRFEEAIAQWRQMALMEKDPVRITLEEEGLKALRTGGIQAYGHQRLETIAKARNGRNNDALALRAVIERHPNDFVEAEWHAYLGDRQIAISELTQSIAERDSDEIDLAINPMFDNIHQYPAFLKLLDRLGLKLPTHYLVQPR